MYFVLKIHLFFDKNKNTQITDIVIVVDRKFFHGVKKKKKKIDAPLKISRNRCGSWNEKILEIFKLAIVRSGHG